MINHQVAKKKKTKSDCLIFLSTLLLTLLINSSSLAKEELLIAIASTVENTGLAIILIDNYQDNCSCEVRYLATGSTRALNLLANNDVDLAITHAPDIEDEFIATNQDYRKQEFMFNEFVLVGNQNIENVTSISQAMQIINEEQLLFITRNDGSGTNIAEINLWEESIGSVPEIYNWYQAAGVQMSRALLIANQKNAYTLSDSGTYLYMYNTRLIDSKIVARNIPALINTYSIMYQEENNFVKWLISNATKELINNYKSNDQQLFFTL